MILGIALIVILMLTLAIRSEQNLEQRNERVLHSKDVIQKTDRLTLDIIRSESAVRAYALTGEHSYRDDYASALTAVNHDMSYLAKAVSDNRAQDKNIADLRSSVSQKISMMDAMNEAAAKGPASAAALAAKKPGAEATSSLTRSIDRISGLENSLLDERTNAETEGRQRTLVISIISILSLAAIVLGTALVSQAIAGQKQRYERLVSSIGDGFVSLDRDWRISHLNDAAARLFQLERRESIGKHFLEVLPHKRGTIVEDEIAKAIQGGSPEIFTAISPTTKRYLEYRVFPSEEGVSIFLHDISERVAAEDEIRRLNATLEQRVLDRTAQLEGFCYSIAHDMRTHIRGVSASASLLAEDLKEVDLDIANRLSILKQSAQHMASLVDGLLAFARNSGKEIAKSDVNLSEEAEKIVRKLQGEEGYARDVRFEIEPDLHTKADPQLAGVVLQNLLDNAAKYKRSNGDAIVHVGRENGAFYVRDNGRGFDQRYALKVFKPFERLHSDLAVSGSGIGLASVQRILQRHGGRAWAESKENEGSTFYFTFGDPAMSDSD